MGLYNVGFAGQAGGEFAERQMEQILKQRMFEEEQARMRAAQEQQAAAEQQRMTLDREQFTEGTRRYEQGRTDDIATAAAVQAEKDDAERRYYEVLSSMSNPAQQRLAEAEHAGIKSGNVHDYELPDVHTAHLETERQAALREVADKANITGMFNAKWREPRAPAASEPLVQIAGPDGSAIWVTRSDAVGKPTARAPRPVTGAERQTLAYYNRAKEATTTLEELEPTVAGSSALEQAQLQYGGNWMQSPEQQRYRQAQRAFTEARLRKESGAAIPEQEYANDARTYFAQPLDDKKTIEQKRRARQTVLEGLKFGSGKAYEDFYGEPNERTPEKPKKFTVVGVETK